jgi:hypothetical protein
MGSLNEFMHIMMKLKNKGTEEDEGKGKLN